MSSVTSCNFNCYALYCQNIIPEVCKLFYIPPHKCVFVCLPAGCQICCASPGGWRSIWFIYPSCLVQSWRPSERWWGMWEDWLSWSYFETNSADAISSGVVLKGKAKINCKLGSLHTWNIRGWVKSGGLSKCSSFYYFLCKRLPFLLLFPRELWILVLAFRNLTMQKVTLVCFRISPFPPLPRWCRCLAQHLLFLSLSFFFCRLRCSWSTSSFGIF